jgi:DNA-3-methyladenine glycosylase II
MSLNLSSTDYLCKADKRLAKIIKNVGDYSIRIRNNAFESLLESIIYQQLTGNAANAIYNKFLRYYNGSIPTASQILSTSGTELRSKVGLSGMKIEYLKDLAFRIADNRLNLDLLPAMTDEDITSQLIKVKGIGRWTADMFLIFCLGRQDVLPITDLGLRKAMQKTYLLCELPRPQTMEEIANPWIPYRSVATWYLWKSLSNFNTIG